MLPDLFEFLAETLLRYGRDSSKSDEMKQFCHLFRDNWNEVELIEADVFERAA